MSNKEKLSKWICFFDVPHRVVMEERGLTFENLGQSLQQQVLDFDKEYIKALEDGHVDEEETQKLFSKSSSIATTILEALEAQKGSNVGPVVGILAGIGLIVGAAFGVRAIIKG